MKGGSNELSMMKMNLRFWDYISMATVGFTFFSEKPKKEELQYIQVGGNKSKKKHPFKCCRMAIGWLRPLQGTSSHDFILLC
jgi:hypothetical protein